jgi:DNA polymerase-3 subunit epsilon
MQRELDALAAIHCPPDRRRYHAALYDALAGSLLLAGLASRPDFSDLTLMQLFTLSTLNPEKRAGLVQTTMF